MSAIGNLKLSSTKRPTAMPAVQLRRNKLAIKVWEQIQLAKAQQSGTTFSVVRHKLYAMKTAQVEMWNYISVYGNGGL